MVKILETIPLKECSLSKIAGLYNATLLAKN